ncbi:hypothetical protein [Rhodococcus sp. NPDC058521]|uniref:PPE domain-containing protein n=1 Tax=Rhodococcus sp. NPDC058521 TaxID=3346536 RepID=UPI003669BFE4
MSDTVSRGTAEFVDSMSGKNRALLDGYDSVTGSDISGWAESRVAQNEGNHQRADLYGEANRIAGEFGLGTLPPTVITESFEAMSHQDIKAKVDSIQPGPVFESSQMWRAAEQDATELITDFQEAIASITASDWQGEAASNAQAAIARYAGESAKLGGAFTLVGNKMEEAYTGFAQVKAQLPEPDTGTSFGDFVRGGIGLIANPGSVVNMVDGNDDARQEAIRVMNTVYTPVVQQADTGVPMLPAAVDPTDPSTGTPGTPGGPGIGPSGGPDISGPSAAPGSPAAGFPQSTAPASTAPSSIGPTAQPPIAPASAVPAAASGLPGSGVGQDSARNPFVAPAAAGLGGGSGSGSLGSGSAGRGVGTGGVGTGGGFGSGASAAPLGAPQKPGAVSPGQASGARAAGGAGAGRMGMGGAMMPPGARGKGDDDTEHKTPDYLVNVQNGNELIGDLPRGAPPVLGGQ